MSSRQKAAARVRVALPADGPGVAVLVLQGDDVLYQSQRGRADVEADVAVTRDTAFNLASVSKHVTAVALLQLVEQGRVALDSTVADVLPQWADYPSGRPLRMTDLLWHTAGLPNYSALWRGAKADARLTNARFLTKVLTHAPEFPAGTQAEYSNTNYILLATVIEKLAGLPFREHVRRALLEPLGMTASGFDPKTNRARGYKREAGRIELSEFPIALVGHSHLFATTADLVRWYRGLWSGQLVSAASLEQALTPGRLDDGTEHIYGFGWYRDKEDDPRSMGHGGSWYGYATHVRRLQTEDRTIVVLSNDETFAAETLTTRLADAFR